MSHYLPSKLPSFLLRLNLHYDRAGKKLERDLIAACRFRVVEETSFDNWNGGTHGHDVFLYLPLEELTKIDIDVQAVLANSICEDLNKLANVENEFFNAVRFELNAEGDLDFQRSFPFSSRPVVNPDALTIWRPGHVRLFVSHRDHHKVAANDLAAALEGFGISSFVAHDTIQPMTEWRKEILKGLETMEIMLVFLTDDFEDSIWTNQEIGYALGKGVPVISLKLGRKDPPGFISHEQALRGRVDAPCSAARGLFPLISKALGRRERLQHALVNAFVAAPDFAEAKVRFDRMNEVVESLTDQDLSTIVEGFYANGQLFNAVYLTSKYERLKRFLERTTGAEFDVEGRSIRRRTKKMGTFAEDLDDVPF